MTLLAQLSDLHLVEDDHGKRTRSERARLSFLSLGRPVDAPSRRARAAEVLSRVRRSAADHLFVTGDLTEDGTEAQFEVLADVLATSGIAPERVTLVPGNHDGYHDASMWTRMLDGPLRPYRDTSRPGALVPLDDVYVVPISTMRAQPFTRAAGAVGSTQLDALAHWLSVVGSNRPVVIAQHHPPNRYVPGAHWVTGLLDHDRLAPLLRAGRHVNVLHGHTHDRTDRALASGEPDRVFCAPAVVECDDATRWYAVQSDTLTPVEAGAGDRHTVEPQSSESPSTCSRNRGT